jgi:hypothetical protein
MIPAALAAIRDLRAVTEDRGMNANESCCVAGARRRGRLLLREADEVPGERSRRKPVGIYTLVEDTGHCDGEPYDSSESLRSVAADAPAAAIWVHRLGEPFAKRLPILDRTVDRVVLEGTFNEQRTCEEQLQRLAECAACCGLAAAFTCTRC